MKAMILAAGRGERMGALTQSVPKPLLKIGKHYLIEYAIANLKRAGITEIVINISYLAELIKTALGDGQRYGVNLHYSEERERLETGGGIVKALPLLGDQPFIVVSADIITDYPLQQLAHQLSDAAHLIMVANPSFHRRGDFALREGLLYLNQEPKLTFANVGIYRPSIFAGLQEGFFPWRDVMFPQIEAGQVTGEFYKGRWHNIGTPDDLAEVNQHPPCL